MIVIQTLFSIYRYPLDLGDIIVEFCRILRYTYMINGILETELYSV